MYHLHIIIMCLLGLFGSKELQYSDFEKWVDTSLSIDLPDGIQAFLYLFSFVLVILISTNYPNLICDGDRYDIIGMLTIEDQIKSVRESVVFDSLYIGIRSLVYSMILIIWVSNKRQ